MSEIKLYWWRHSNGAVNYGDDLSPIIVERLSGRSVKYASLERCQLIAAGSLLDRVFMRRWKRIARLNFRPLMVWGSGSLGPLPHPPSNLFISAVRGPNTRDAMGLTPSLPLGDPALLLSQLISWPRKTYRWGIIPHVVDQNHPLINHLGTQSGVRIIDLTNPDPIATAVEIASCDFIASSSLHGIISADAFGIPNIWIQISNALDGGSWKFEDYFASVNRKVPATAISQFNLREAENFARIANPKTVELRCSNLRLAFNQLVL